MGIKRFIACVFIGLVIGVILGFINRLFFNIDSLAIAIIAAAIGGIVVAIGQVTSKRRKENDNMQ